MRLIGNRKNEFHTANLRHLRIRFGVVSGHGGALAPLELIEVQTGRYLGEDDIERIEDNYKRT